MKLGVVVYFRAISRCAERMRNGKRRRLPLITNLHIRCNACSLNIPQGYPTVRIRGIFGWGAGMAQWLSICLPCRPPTIVARVRFPGPCSERFFSRYSGFPLSSKANISKFQFDLESDGHRFYFVSRIVLLSVTLVK